ncbi:hypothetical protein [Agromyces sp. NBRC 114283]|nr:hypothetical protein [Agromyces sp. NBRC 114283]GLU88924.1 hypothetical protein Agsp01_11790 [Agromyces sp. NBRC 114283]
MARRTMLEQEIYEQMIEQGVDEMTADIVASEVADDMEGGER